MSEIEKVYEVMDNPKILLPYILKRMSPTMMRAAFYDYLEDHDIDPTECWEPLNYSPGQPGCNKGSRELLEKLKTLIERDLS